MKVYSKEFEEFYSFLDTLDLDDISKKDKNSLDYVARRDKTYKYVDYFLKYLKILKSDTILEIGPGYGYFAEKFLIDHQIKNYTLLDHPSMLRICKSNLNNFKNISYVPSEEYLSVNFHSILISTLCFSEILIGFRHKLYHTFFNLCDKVFIIDGGDYKEPSFNKDLLDHLKFYYTNVSVESLSSEFKNCEIFIGNKV